MRKSDGGAEHRERDPEPYRTRVLLAEDNDLLRDLFASMLRSEGYEVIRVKDGSRLLEQIALARARAEPIDLIVSGARMPGRSGLEVLESLRRVDWKTPFVLMTAYSADQLRAEARRLGAVVVEKPFRLEELMAVVLRLAPPTGPSSPEAHPVVLNGRGRQPR